MCNVKDLNFGDEPTKNLPNTAVLISFKGQFSFFLLIVLVLDPTTLRFWFILTVLVYLTVNNIRQLFTQKARINTKYTTCASIYF